MLILPIFILYIQLNCIFCCNFKRTYFIFIKKVLVTWSRSSTIIPSMLGHTIAVYNGREHLVLLISDQMIGHMSFYYYELIIQLFI